MLETDIITLLRHKRIKHSSLREAKAILFCLYELVAAFQANNEPFFADEVSKKDLIIAIINRDLRKWVCSIPPLADCLCELTKLEPDILSEAATLTDVESTENESSDEEMHRERRHSI